MNTITLMDILFSVGVLYFVGGFLWGWETIKRLHREALFFEKYAQNETYPIAEQLRTYTIPKYIFCSIAFAVLWPVLFTYGMFGGDKE